MQTRRQILRQSICLPVAARQLAVSKRHRFEIIAEAHCLSNESARGFAMVSPPCGDFIVVCGGSHQSLARAAELRRRAAEGAWIIWESAPASPANFPDFQLFRENMRTAFGLNVGTPFHPGLYVEYLWPHSALTRSFLAAVPACCASAQVVARCGDQPVAMKRAIGHGGIIFLGSMLGPNLYAEEPQAHRIVAQIFRRAPSV